jgi:hypothetical protein
LTTVGWIGVDEQCWRQAGQRVRPLCLAAQVEPRGSSRRLQRAMTDFGADEAFAVAAAKLREHYGLPVAVTRVQRVCEHHAHRLAGAVGEPTRTLAPTGPAAIVAEADGTMIPVVDLPPPAPGLDRRRQRQVRWQEMRLVAARAQGRVRTHYAAGFDTPAQTGVRWTQVVRQAGWSARTFVHGVGDGAEWIAQQFQQHFGRHGHYTLDLFHVCDYLAAAAPDPTASAAFVATHRQALRDGQAPAVIAALAQRCEPPEQAEELAPVRQAHRYLNRRLDQLDYPAALARQLPIGSGLIESGNRHVLHGRLKKAGAWWLPANAHAMAQLRTCRANGLWDSLWAN